MISSILDEFSCTWKRTSKRRWIKRLDSWCWNTSTRKRKSSSVIICPETVSLSCRRRTNTTFFNVKKPLVIIWKENFTIDEAKIANYSFNLKFGEAIKVPMVSVKVLHYLLELIVRSYHVGVGKSGNLGLEFVWFVNHSYRLEFRINSSDYALTFVVWK